MNLLDSAHAHALYKTMVEALDAFQKAGADYQSAMATAIDRGTNADGA